MLRIGLTVLNFDSSYVNRFVLFFVLKRQNGQRWGLETNDLQHRLLQLFTTIPKTCSAYSYPVY